MIVFASTTSPRFPWTKWMIWIRDDEVCVYPNPSPPKLFQMFTRNVLLLATLLASAGAFAPSTFGASEGGRGERDGGGGVEGRLFCFSV